MKNKFFKDWKKANDFLNAFIDDHFGLYLSIPSPETAYITFLPEDKLSELIPAEQACKLNERARVYTEHVNKFVEKHNLLGDVPDNFPMVVKEALIKSKCEAMLESYEKVYKKTMLVALKQYLGLRIDYDKLCESPKDVRIHIRFSTLNPGVFKALASCWNTSSGIVEAVFEVFEGSFDAANEYLEFMYEEDYMLPSKAWDRWTMKKGMDFGAALNNPFRRKK